MRRRWEEAEEGITAYVDIDGVLNYYPDTWLEFLQEEVPEFVSPYMDLNQVKSEIPYQVYRNLKWKYRESGYKQNLTPRDGSKELLTGLKEIGYNIVILTSRPVNKHPSLFKQTVKWLDNNELPYDDLIFDKDKQVAIVTRYPHLSFGIEDHRYYANQVARWGYNMFLLNNGYNQGQLVPGVVRIETLGEVLRYVETWS